jgi:hypothetical protein
VIHAAASGSGLTTSEQIERDCTIGDLMLEKNNQEIAALMAGWLKDIK